MDYVNFWSDMATITGAKNNLKAAYRYDPYGRLRGWTGTEADDNPFRFSTKLWLDFGPVYYGNAGAYNMTYGLYDCSYRHYAPEFKGHDVSVTKFLIVSGWQGSFLSASQQPHGVHAP